MYEDFIIKRKNITKKDIGQGILMQNLGRGEEMNVLHWNMQDGNIVEWHEHPNEQFGYVIQGGFEIFMDDEQYTIGAGDAYFIPENVKHKFIAIGETEAIDIFHPIKKDIPGS